MTSPGNHHMWVKFFYIFIHNPELLYFQQGFITDQVYNDIEETNNGNQQVICRESDIFSN